MKDQNSEKGFAIAAILASIHPIAWYFTVLLLFLLIATSAILNWHQIPAFISSFLFWLRNVLIAVCILAIIKVGIWFHNTYHDIVTKVYERRAAREKAKKQFLQNEVLVQKIEMQKQMPLVLRYAMEQGHNVEYADLKVSNYLSNIHMLQSGAKVEQIASPDYIPEPFKFSEVLQSGWKPTKDGILLAKKDDFLLCPTSEGLCHTTFTGNTDSGKTSDERLILIQLLYLREVVFICDKNYQSQRIDKKSGVVYDYRPIERLLAHSPITESRDTLNFLLFALQELDRRRALRRFEPVDFPDWYIFIDELPAFCAEESEIMKHVGRIVREARQYGIFFVGAAQDVLLNTLGGDNGAVRKNFLTNFYGGGDATTAKLMLNIAPGESIDETGLGKMGIKYIRAKGAGIERVKARVPLSDDLATQILLSNLTPMSQIEIPEVVESNQPDKDLDIVYEACMRLKEEGVKVTTDRVTELVPFSRGKVGNLMKALKEQGIEVR